MWLLLYIKYLPFMKIYIKLINATKPSRLKKPRKNKNWKPFGFKAVIIWSWLPANSLILQALTHNIRDKDNKMGSEHCVHSYFYLIAVSSIVSI